jgi:hypothetical protein
MARKSVAAISESRPPNHTTCGNNNNGNGSNHVPPAPDAALKSLFMNSPLAEHKASKKSIEQEVFFY